MAKHNGDFARKAHFQLGETDQAEMTILEAIRHQPLDLDMRMDYLRIARETLPSKRYLQELEKVRDIFPDSTEILWKTCPPISHC